MGKRMFIAGAALAVLAPLTVAAPASASVPHRFTGGGTLQQAGTSRCAAVNADSGSNGALIVMTACGSVPSQQQSFNGAFVCSGGDHVTSNCPSLPGNLNSVYGGDLIVNVVHRDNGKCWEWVSGSGLQQQGCAQTSFEQYIEDGVTGTFVSVAASDVYLAAARVCGGPNGTQLTANPTCGADEWSYRSN